MEKINKNLEVLPYCKWCESRIRVEEKWIYKKDNPDLFNDYVEFYKDKLSHGICPPCLEKILQENGFEEDK